MTVSRKGKRGRRAGTMRPSGRNGRVTKNARSAAMIGTKVDDRRTRLTPDEWVLMVAKEAIGSGSRDGMLHRDDLVSDVILQLLDAGGFKWEEDAIVAFCRDRARKIMSRHIWRVERTEAELTGDDKDDLATILTRNSVQAPMQELSYMAAESVGLLRAIPNAHRAALEVLCDGGNPVEVAEEQGITVAEAIRLIKEARAYVSRVDPA